MDLITPYIAMDRRQAMALAGGAGQGLLPERTWGAALFADISGFTPLTESLVKELGRRRGPEELARQVNEVYDALIAELYRYRGSVISFSGDAITCWIDGDDGRKAAAAGLGMLRAMAQFNEVLTPSGRIVSLGLKIAITTGPVRRFVVGDPEIFLLEAMTGETLERMAAGEHVAERGDLVMAESAVAALREAVLPDLPVKEWRVAEETAERFAVISPAAARTFAIPEDPWPIMDEAALPEESKAPWVLPPVYRRLTQGLGDFLAEIRPVVAIFIRFSGIDYDHDLAAPAKLDQFIRRVQGTLARYDGNLLQITIGDKGSYLYISFGAPIVHEDDPTRAAAAALQLNAIAQELDFIDDLQIGITVGPLRTGSSGSTTRKTYVALGDTVNLAARLMIAAKPGQILVSAELREATGRSFKWETLPAVKVKGKQDPVALSRLISRKRFSSSQEDAELHGVQTYRTPMVGRQEEVGSIAEKLDLVLAGQGQIVTLTAEAGMGKSRLAAVATEMARERGLTIHNGECQAYGSQTSYLVWQPIWQRFFGMDIEQPEGEQIERLAGILRDIDPDLVGRLPLLGAVVRLVIPDNALTAYLDAKVRKSSLEEMLLRCLQVQSVLEPILILLDDVHWIDPLSADLLELLARGVAHLPVMILLLRRPADKVSGDGSGVLQPGILPYHSEIELTEFSTDEAQQLVQLKLVQYFGESAAAPLLVKRIQKQAGGNPFYIEQILDYVHDLGIDPQDEAAIAAVDLPQSIYSLVLSRIDQLGENEQITLKIASVIGRSFRVATLYGVFPQSADMQRIQGDLETLSNADLAAIDTPEPDLAYLFKHVITQEVAYESLLYVTRAMLHEQIGRYIETTYADRLRVFTFTLAFHYGRSENKAKKIDYLLKAGEVAQKQFANAAAVEYFTQALPFLEGRLCIDVRLNLGQVYELTAEFDAAQEVIDSALRDAESMEDQDAIGWCRTAQGELARKQNHYDQAAEWFSLARQTFEDEIPGGNKAGIGQVLHYSGTLAAQEGRYEEANERYTASLALRRELGDRQNEANVLNNMGIVARYLGDPERARGYHEAALAIQEELGNRWTTGAILNNLGQMALDAGRYEEAHRQYDQALLIWREIGARWATTNTIHNLANVARDEGDFEDARERYLEAAERWQELGDKWGLAYWLEDVAVYFALQAGLRQAQPSTPDSPLATPPLALQLLGTADALREEIGNPRPPAYQKKLEERVGVVGGKEDGRRLSVEQAVALL